MAAAAPTTAVPQQLGPADVAPLTRELSSTIVNELLCALGYPKDVQDLNQAQATEVLESVVATQIAICGKSRRASGWKQWAEFEARAAFALIDTDNSRTISRGVCSSVSLLGGRSLLRLLCLHLSHPHWRLAHP
jgi:hypothetical protein